ncbi:MAG: hypothetical protein QOI66_2891, partial [Myxococcales bacterium]|nr:hypothetical protein [Myxococcales bacterium]
MSIAFVPGLDANVRYWLFRNVRIRLSRPDSGSLREFGRGGVCVSRVSPLLHHDRRPRAQIVVARSGRSDARADSAPPPVLTSALGGASYLRPRVRLQPVGKESTDGIQRLCCRLKLPEDRQSKATYSAASLAEFWAFCLLPSSGCLPKPPLPAGKTRTGRTPGQTPPFPRRICARAGQGRQPKQIRRRILVGGRVGSELGAGERQLGLRRRSGRVEGRRGGRQPKIFQVRVIPSVDDTAATISIRPPHRP